MKIKFKLFCSFLLFMILSFSTFLQVVIYAAENAEEVHWQDYNGRRIGVLTGTLMEDIASENFPDSEYLYFSSYPDLNTALH